MSIIMPIYNAGSFLYQSLDSAVCQTFENIEIVCVNDGSTDASLGVMRDYARRDRRIKVIDKPNGGYGHAMNVGISAATGEYVMILEPDDFMEL
ncbi:MAG: glycosyltransferase family 2 protein, partial [Atopobiaceae bacterium]|nr:glycosyltransferase family 2 protein [Atopobiaceae bacterium]